MLVEKLDHRRDHCEIEKEKESDSGVLVVSQQLSALEKDKLCYASR